MSLTNLFSKLKGGAGSGNHGHIGRIGQRGGSAQKISTMGLSGLGLDPWVEWDSAKKIGDMYIVDDGDKLHSALIRDRKVLAKTSSRLHGGRAGIPRAYTMSGSESLEQGKGLGTELYIAVMKYTYPIPISAEFQQSESAKGLHASLKRRPDVEDLGDGRLLYQGPVKKDKNYYRNLWLLNS